MNRTLGCVLLLALAACAGSQGSSSGMGSQAGTGSASQGGTSSQGPSGQQGYRARLDPANEVPPANVGSASPAGTADFTSDGTTIVYRVHVTGLSSPYTAAHIHLGGPGVAGPVVVALPLSAGSTDGTVDGEGTIQSSQITGKNPDGSTMSMDDLLNAMRSGRTYVNVHTENNKSGELRGPIETQGP